MQLRGQFGGMEQLRNRVPLCVVVLLICTSTLRSCAQQTQAQRNQGHTSLRMTSSRANALRPRRSDAPVAISSVRTKHTLTVFPDQDQSAAFTLITRKSGVTLTGVVDAVGKRAVRKDFPDSSRGAAENAIAKVLSDDDRASGRNLFVKVMGCSTSSFINGFAIVFDKNVGSYAQFLRSPADFEAPLAGVTVSEIMAGVAKMHVLGFAHNDLKPDNVLNVRSGSGVNYVLCDFGLSGPSDRKDYARGTDGYRFPFVGSTIVGQHADYWSTALMGASFVVRAQFLATWDVTSLGQEHTTQETLDDFVMCKLRRHKASALAVDFRFVLVRDPSSPVTGLDPRLAREALSNVVAFLARREMLCELALARGGAPPQKRERETCPPFFIAPTKSFKRHKRRDAAKRRKRQQQVAGVFPVVCFPDLAATSIPTSQLALTNNGTQEFDPGHECGPECEAARLLGMIPLSHQFSRAIISPRLLTFP